MKLGTQFLEMFWYFVADRVVNTAIQYYQLDKERADALRRVYLRPGDYVIRPRNMLQ
jgi:hypothetical protein